MAALPHQRFGAEAAADFYGPLSTRLERSSDQVFRVDR